jgi:hypothetical protein
LPSEEQERQYPTVREVLGIIADNLKKAGWSYGYVSALDSEGRTTWIADAHRGDGKRFVVRADEKLIAFDRLSRNVRMLQLRDRQAARSWQAA